MCKIVRFTLSFCVIKERFCLETVVYLSLCMYNLAAGNFTFPVCTPFSNVQFILYNYLYFITRGIVLSDYLFSAAV